MLVKNLLRIIIVSLLACSIFFIGLFLGFNIGVNKGAESVIKGIESEPISKEINKPTTEVVNNTDNTTNIEKIKAKNDSKISTLLENKNDSKAELNSVFDTVKNNDDMWCLPIEKLSKRTKRLIEKDLK